LEEDLPVLLAHGHLGQAIWIAASYRTGHKMPKRTNQDFFDKEVGRRIRAQRLAKNLSQTELADHLGVSFQQVQKYENGANRVVAGRLQQISDLLEVPISYFYQTQKKKAPQVSELLDFLDTSRAFRLMKAYSQIRDKKLQSTLVEFVETMVRREK
jgi:transcriptional regulator with XRE-family HTH domain